MKNSLMKTRMVTSSFLSIRLIVLVIGTLVLNANLSILNAGEYQRRAFAVEVVQEDPAVEGLGDDKYAGGGVLKTDPDLEDRLKKADEYRKDGNFRVASKLWQSVLDQSGDILYPDEKKETYYSMTKRVESILAELPAGGISTYRIAADAAAREILAQSKGDYDLETHTRVVKSYFMSSFGDESAYKLGCIYLDQYDFVGAARLLQKVAEQYPDPTVPLSDVWMRLAIAYTFIGDRDSAETALNKANEAGADNESRLYESITALMKDSPQLDRKNSASSQWTTRLGNATRMGQMPSLPASFDEDLMAVWQYHYEPNDTYLKEAYKGGTIAKFDLQAIKDSVSEREEKMIAAWRKGNWRPAGTLLFNEKHVAFRTGSDLTVWNRNLESEPVWRPLWLNHFNIDAASQAWQQLYEHNQASSKKKRSVPKSASNVQMFGDQIAQSMTTHRGVLYSIEGKEYSWKDTSPGKRRSVQQSGYPYGSTPRRTRTNRLAAYNMDNGKIMWRLPTVELLAVARSDHDAKVAEKTKKGESESEENHFEDIGFMAAPVGFGDLLLAPVNVSGSIWIYALDSRNEGKLAWKSYLCDEPGSGSQPWSPIHISVAGSTAYVNCGTGVVFAVDPMTGGIRFARKYIRTGDSFNLQYHRGGEVLELDGWSEDIVIPVGSELIMFASDYNAVWAIDRQTAKFRWKTENRPFGNKFDYLIGITDEYIFLGGPETVAAISIKAQGRWTWVHSFERDTSRGRAMMTEDAIYVPLDSKIVKLGHDGKEGSGDVQATMNVRLGTRAPLGNLFSDGERIWVVGGNRLYALGPDDGTDDPSKSDESKQDEGQQDEGQQQSALRDLQETISLLNQERETLVQKFGNGHPDMVSINRRIELYEELARSVVEADMKAGR